jgi:hypothetical protein
MVERILGGEHRIKRALSRMMDCREAGDREGALQALRDVLAVEVVPMYRQMAQENLDRYDEPPPLCERGPWASTLTLALSQRERGPARAQPH